MKAKTGTFLVRSKLTEFPKQGPWLGKNVKVMFNHDRSNMMAGWIVRDDEEEPFLVLIHLTDGHFVTDKECQYTLM